MRFYFDSLMGGGDTAETNYVKPNVNCNRSSWIDGCELLLCSTIEEEEIGDDGRQAAARDGTTSLVW